MSPTQKILEEISKDKEDNEAILDKIRKLIEHDKAEAMLSPEEMKKIRNIISVYESVQALGRFATAARNVILFLGTLIVGWFVLVNNASLLWQKIIAFMTGQ